MGVSQRKRWEKRERERAFVIVELSRQAPNPWGGRAGRLPGWAG